MYKIFIALPLAIALSATVACDKGNPVASGTSKAATNTADIKKTVHLKVDGMTCGGCVSAIVNKVDTLDGVVSCDVSLENRSATVALSDPKAATTVEDAIRKLGYTVEPEDTNPAS